MERSRVAVQTPSPPAYTGTVHSVGSLVKPRSPIGCWAYDRPGPVDYADMRSTAVLAGTVCLVVAVVVHREVKDGEPWSWAECLVLCGGGGVLGWCSVGDLVAL